MQIINYKEKSKTYFDNEAHIYDVKGDGVFVAPMYGEIISRVISLNPKSILDLGCGTGNVLKALQGKDIKLNGLDLSEKMITVAKEALNEEVNLKIGDSENIPWQDNSFDVVVCNASFHHYPNPSKVLKEIKRVLKNNGVLVFGDPTAPAIIRQILNCFCKYSNSGDYKIYSKNEIVKLFKDNKFKPEMYKKINYKSFVINGVVEK